MTTTMIQRLQRRKKYPIQLSDDVNDVVHARALTLDELDRLPSLPPDLQTAFALGSALLNEDGSQGWAKATLIEEVDGAKVTRLETDLEFAKRILPDIREMGTDTIADVSAAIQKLGKTPPVEELAKN